MALRTPPSWLQNGSHPAENDRLSQQAVFSSTGVIGSGSLQITAQASPNMTVIAAAGWASILSSTALAGVYVIYNDAATTLTITTADATNPRIDRIVATIRDSYYSGANNDVIFQVLPGTPAVSPSAPATPSNSISLATIAVAANTTTITSGNITDTRSLTSSSLISQYAFPLTGGTLSGAAILAPNASGLAPIKFQSGTLNSPLVPGALEYDGSAFYSAPSSVGTLTTNGGRAVIQSNHFYSLSADRALSAGVTTAQSMFNVGLSLAASTTYEIEINGQLKITNSTSTTDTIAAILAFSSTPTSLDGNCIGALVGGASNINLFAGNPLTATIGTVSTTSPSTVSFFVKALVRTNAATVLTPQVSQNLGANSSFAVTRNTYVKVTPLGASSSNSQGAWA